jgi:hypothetical protein
MRQVCTIICLALLATQAQAEEAQEWRVRFEAGKTYAASKGWLNGSETSRYIVSAKAGQRFSIKFEPMGSACDLHVLAPGDEHKIYDWSASSEQFRRTIDKTGDYIALVHISPDEARSGGKCTYFLRFELK